MPKEKLLKIIDKIMEYSFYGIIFFIPISKAGIGIFCILASVAFLVKKFLNPDFHFLKDNKLAYGFLLLFIFFMAMSLVNSGPYTKLGLRALFGKWIQYIFVFLMAVDTFKDFARLRNAIVLSMSVLGLVILSCCAQKFLGLEFIRHKSMWGLAITGPFSNPNGLSAYLIFSLLILLSLAMIKYKRKIYEYLAYLFAFFTGCALLLTLSRGAWFGFLLGGFFLALLTRKHRRIMLFLSLFVFSIFLASDARARVTSTLTMVAKGVDAVAMSTVAAPKAQEMRAENKNEDDAIKALGSEESAKGIFGNPERFDIWRGALTMIQEHPFLGKGLGTFMNYFEQYFPSIGIFYAHNCYLQMWAESGVFSLMAFLCFAGLILGQAAMIAFANRHKNNGIILAGLTAGLFGFLVHAFFDNHLYSLQLKALFWVMLGITVALGRILAGENSCREENS